MSLRVFALAVLFGLIGSGAWTTESRAAPPSYLILRTPGRVHKTRLQYPAESYEVRATPYAYGWFGAQPRRHWYRSTGYLSNYIQWTKR